MMKYLLAATAIVFATSNVFAAPFFTQTGTPYTVEFSVANKQHFVDNDEGSTNEGYSFDIVIVTKLNKTGKVAKRGKIYGQAVCKPDQFSGYNVVIEWSGDDITDVDINPKQKPYEIADRLWHAVCS